MIMDFVMIFCILLAVFFIFVFGGALIKDADEKLGCGGWLVSIVLIALAIILIQSC